MNIPLDAPRSWVADSTPEENHIRAIFYQHWEKLKNHLMKSVNLISQWRETLINEANKYVEEQWRILANEYQQQKDNLERICEENLVLTRELMTQSSDMFNRFQNECKLLQFNMAQLENVNSNIVTLRVVTVLEQNERQKTSVTSDSSTIITPEALTSEQIHNVCNNNDVNNSVTVSSMSPTAIKRDLLSVTAEPNHKDNGLLSNKQILQMDPDSYDNDNSISSCPLCYMIFSVNMGNGVRAEHINAHYTDI